MEKQLPPEIQKEIDSIFDPIISFLFVIGLISMTVSLLLIFVVVPICNFNHWIC